MGWGGHGVWGMVRASTVGVGHREMEGESTTVTNEPKVTSKSSENARTSLYRLGRQTATPKFTQKLGWLGRKMNSATKRG